MLWKVKLKLLIDKVSNLLPKKKKPAPKYGSLLYAQRKTEPQKPKENRAIAFLLPFVRECGAVMWGDLKWIMTRRNRCAADVWAEAIERMQKER